MSNKNDSTIERTRLLCGRSVPTWLYKAVMKRALICADELEMCKPYTLRMICGDEYWHGLGGHKTNAGLIMAQLVDLQLVPYQFASERDAKPLWYRLKP